MDALAKLQSHFQNSDLFVFPDDVKKITDNTNFIEAKAAVASALNQMVDDKYLSKFDDEEGGRKFSTYVLFISEKDRNVEVSISKETAKNIANICNQFLPLINTDIEGNITPEDIGEREFLILLSITQVFAQRLAHLEEEQNKNKEREKKNKKVDGEEDSGLLSV